MRGRIAGLRPSAITGGAPTLPLVVLFSLNAVDELDREAFNVLIPNIREDFGLSIAGVLTLTSVAGVLVLLLEVPIAHLADRLKRTRLAALGTGTWGLFAFLTGLAPVVWMLAAARVGTGVGRLTTSSTHNSLLADYYPVSVRPKVYAAHRAANNLGQFVGPLLAGVLAYFFGWRTPFIILLVPTVFLVLLALRLHEPVRGGHERRTMGADDETIATEEEPASFAEACRILWQVRSLRRIWIALPFLGVALVGIRPLLQIFYEEQFGLNEAERGVIASIAEPAGLIGLMLGVPLAARMAGRDPGLLVKFIGVSGTLSAAALLGIVTAPNVAVAVALSAVLQGVSAALFPGLWTAFSLILPPRVRSIGFSLGSVFVIPGLVIAPVVGLFADEYGIRTAIILTLPLILLGCYLIASGGWYVAADVLKVRTATVAMSEVRAARRRGEAKLLLVRDLDVAYDGVQVLFGVDLEVDEGEIVALLGTNGAGKSTLLKTISGLVEASAGAVVFDGRETTYAPPNEVAAKGIVQVPGGRGVFPQLTVEENLKAAAWLLPSHDGDVAAAIASVLETFPQLRSRFHEAAGNLSGGEQQMLGLGMAFIAKPRLLMIDELSLGLAPTVVEQLLDVVRAIQRQGTTIILVEQSVNVALTVAERAYFMEKGEIRFEGATAELLDRPDVLRSVFLEGAVSRNGPVAVRPRATSSPTGARPLLEVTGVTRAFGSVRALDDVSLSVTQGQLLGIIGPNGAGKTTLFDLLSGFLPVDAGVITFDGRDITSLGAPARARLGIGRSFQDARLFPGMTVAETIACALDRSVRWRDPVSAALRLPPVLDSEADVADRVAELVELMGVGAFRDKFVGELSTGSRRIVDLACVLAHEPSLVLFDEPSSGIAQRETERLGPLLLQLRQATGAAMVVIEHDMPLITSIADELVALDLGRVIARGSPDQVVHDPGVVASYLGTNESVVDRSAATTEPTGRIP